VNNRSQKEMEAYKKSPEAMKSLRKIQLGAKDSKTFVYRDPLGNLWDPEGNYLGRIGFVGGKTILLQLPPLKAKEATQMIKTGDTSQAARHYNSFLDYLKRVEGKRLDAEAAKEEREVAQKQSFAERKRKFDEDAEAFLKTVEEKRLAGMSPEQRAAHERMLEERAFNLAKWKQTPLEIDYPTFLPTFDTPSFNKYLTFSKDFYDRAYFTFVRTGIISDDRQFTVWAFQINPTYTNAYDSESGKFLGRLVLVNKTTHRIVLGGSPDPMDDDLDFSNPDGYGSD
jgi:hypothetical protein